MGQALFIRLFFLKPSESETQLSAKESPLHICQPCQEEEAHQETTEKRNQTHHQEIRHQEMRLHQRNGDSVIVE